MEYTILAAYIMVTHIKERSGDHFKEPTPSEIHCSDFLIDLDNKDEIHTDFQQT